MSYLDIVSLPQKKKKRSSRNQMQKDKSELESEQTR